MTTSRIAYLLCLSLCACSGETRPAVSPPVNGEQQNPVPPAGPAPATSPGSEPNVQPNVPPTETAPPEQVPSGSSRIDTSRVSAGNLIAAPERRRGDDFVPGALPQAAKERLSAEDEDLLLVPHDRLRDFRITEELRQTLMSDANLSLGAKRVGIHTVDGEVTLRGVVRSLAERSAIIATARRIAGDEHVGAWIEIKR